jgi:hypothetical protein
VALFGALAAVWAIRGPQGTSTPYDVPVALAVLRVPLEALTALGEACSQRDRHGVDERSAGAAVGYAEEQQPEAGEGPARLAIHSLGS